jgi:hypothetical protein
MLIEVIISDEFADWVDLIEYYLFSIRNEESFLLLAVIRLKIRNSMNV